MRFDATFCYSEFEFIPSLFLFLSKSKLFWLKFFIFIFCVPEPVDLTRCRLLLEFTRLDGFEKVVPWFIFDRADYKAALTDGFNNFEKLLIERKLH